jgi:DNA-nicking Smr family endonuclease
MATKGNDKGINNPFKRFKAELAALGPKAQQARAQAAAEAQRAAARASAQSAQRAEEVLSDAELFVRANSGTQTLSGIPERVLPKPVAKPPQATDDAIALAELEDLVRGEGSFRVHESEEYHYGLAPGVNFALLDDLKRGRFAYQQCLDLHGMIRQAAHAEVARFISQSRCRDGATCVLVVTGRGKSSPGGTSVLRDALPRWLSRAPIRAHVLAFCTARAVDGGPGAFYVLLRRQGMKPFGEVLP